MSAEPNVAITEDDPAAAAWAAAQPGATTLAESVAPASFANFAPTNVNASGNDINMVLDIPVLNWAIPLAVAGWIAFSGHWLQGSLLAANTALLKLPTGIVPIVVNQLLTRRSGMNPKYGLLKCKHGKSYPFE